MANPIAPIRAKAHWPFAKLASRYVEAAFWTALQTFFAVVIVDGGFETAALVTGGVAAGLAVVNTVLLPLASRRMQKLNSEGGS